jgi:hypothetical protein
MTAVWTLLAGLLLAVGAWSWAARDIGGATRVALVAVLGATAAAFNVVVPVPSIEATTTVVLCVAAVLGARSGIAVGIVAVLGSSITGGVGAWTLWQVVAASVVAAIGVCIGSRDLGFDWYVGAARIRLAVGAVLATVAWDVIVTVGGAASYATQPGLTRAEQVVAALLLGLMFTVVHVVFTTAFTVLGGPPLLHALQRASPRLDGGELQVTGVPAAGARSRSPRPTSPPA